MDYAPPSEIVQLGIEAARELLGEDAVVHLRVEEREDSTEKPAYYFYFDIKKGKVFNFPPGHLRIRLTGKLIDRLYDRGDTHFPYVISLVVTDREVPDGA